ncbi:hypothetical protein Bbelb_417080 [Branchiostoma belcheri]|nr:hypothetical protein Bbelb_417080 [Branchiostoma belcheri]
MAVMASARAIRSRLFESHGHKRRNAGMENDDGIPSQDMLSTDFVSTQRRHGYRRSGWYKGRLKTISDNDIIGDTRQTTDTPWRSGQHSNPRTALNKLTTYQWPRPTHLDLLIATTAQFTDGSVGNHSGLTHCRRQVLWRRVCLLRLKQNGGAIAAALGRKEGKCLGLPGADTRFLTCASGVQLSREPAGSTRSSTADCGLAQTNAGHRSCQRRYTAREKPSGEGDNSGRTPDEGRLQENSHHFSAI